MTGAPSHLPLPESIDAAEFEDPDELTPTRFSMERGLLVIGQRTELILVRHAQQLRTLKEALRPGGPGLSDFGRAQAGLTGEYLAADQSGTTPITAVYCSDLNRTAETAEIIAAAVTPSAAPISDPQLREVDMYSRDRGGADVSADIQEEAGEEFARTLRWDAFPNTESSREFRLRIYRALERIADKHTNERVLVVSHAGAISSFFAHLTGAEPDMFYFAGHASVNRVYHGDDRFVTGSLNEVGHLRNRAALTF
ncbi:histidine phosphatase family protein [Rhodococcus jostii]|uniref:histidine phosphatase family protein n=1 Tax=Rhodococcus jostii TaxID=132919 RepID=UPI00364B2869